MIDKIKELIEEAEAFTAESIEEVEAFRAACIKCWVYAMANPEEIIHLIKNEYKSIYSIESMRYEYSVLKKEIILPDLVEIGHPKIQS